MAKPSIEKTGKKNEETARYTIYGILFGCCFPVVATVVDVLARGLDLGFASVVQVQRQNFLHWIIDTAPLFLGLLARLAGRFLDRARGLNATLRESESKYRHLYETMTQGVVIQDAEGGIVDANPAACDILGLSKKQTDGSGPGKTRLNLFHEDGAAYASSEMPAGIALRTGRTVENITCRIGLPEKGDFRWIVVSSVPQFSGRDTNPSSTVTVFSDITQRKESEETLKKERERLSGILKGTNSGTWEWNVQSGETVFNDRWFGIIGYTREECSPVDIETWIKFCHPEDLKVSNKLLESHFQGDSDYYEFEARMRHKNGQWIWVLDRGRVVTWTNEGKPLKMMGTHQDITERKTAERALLESERKYKRITDGVPGNVMTYMRKPDGNDQLLHVSKGVEKLYEVSQEAAMRNTGLLWERVHADDVDHIREALVESAKNLTEVEAEHRLVMPNGSIKWVHSVGIPSRQEDGATVWDTVQLEVTDKKSLELQLQQSQKMEAVGRLAGGVAHDFNNMLGVILGNVELTMSEMSPDLPSYSDLEEIKSAAERSADLTRQLLAFARKQNVVRTVVDINKTVTNMTSVLRRLIGEPVKLTWLPGNPLWPVLIDPGQIDQIMANLCVNARDAIAGAGEIKIETANLSLDAADIPDGAELRPGEYVMIRVSDNGCGMNPETLDKVFEPFFTTKENEKGTGLGLATVYGIVKQNNGHIRVDSEPGERTTFEIYFPRYTVERIETEPRKPVAARGGAETILLVEDEPAILRVTTKTLVKEGYRVIGAHTPGEAIRLAEEHADDIDLILSDVVMPEMNGRDLVASIQSVFPDAGILFMSGHTADVIELHDIMEGEVNFLQKPYTIAALKAKVREVLNEEPSRELH